MTPLLIGIPGIKANAALIRRLKKINAAGILILARNIESPKCLSALTQEIVQRLGRPILFAIDHEGGNVVRFSAGLTSFPSAAALGRTQDHKIAYAVGRQMAIELSKLGINLNLAPVLDLAGAFYNPGIGIRSLGDNAKLVSKMGASLIQGIQDHGVWACAKHFPGMGEARLDPHIHVPRIDISKKALAQDHLPPFRAAIKAGVGAMMTSHIRYPKIDSSLATFSHAIATQLLREKLGFKGVVISDDLSMGAITKSCKSFGDAAVQSFRAGHDLLIIASEQETPQRQAAETLLQAAEKNPSLAAALQSSRFRISTLLKQETHPPVKKTKASTGQILAANIAQKAVRILNKEGVKLPIKSDRSPLLVIFPKLSEVKAKFAFEGGPGGPKKLLKQILKKWGNYKLLESSLYSPQTKNASSAIARAKNILCFCFEARRFPGQAAILHMINEDAPKKSAIVLMRGSTDLPLIGKKTTVIDPAGDRLCQINAALEVILE